MDPNYPVASNPVITLFSFVVVVGLLLFLIAKWKWHIFLALLLPIILFGIIPGVNHVGFIEAFESGFGGTLGKIGVVIVLGSIIAEALKHTGAVQVITQSMIRLVGRKRIPLALTLSGFILGIAIFSDVAYVILNPLVHSLAHSLGVNLGVVSVGLVGSLQLTHAIVPPTPGPLAAAAILGADIGKIIIFGGTACIFGSLASWIWGQYIIGPRLDVKPAEEYVSKSLLNDSGAGSLPGVLSSYAPIFIPVFLISAQSLANLILNEENLIRNILSYAGWPVVALSVGVWLAFRNIRSKEDRKKAKNEWVENGLRNSAMILVVTGLGGSLSAILKGTPAVNYITEIFTAYGLPSLFLPFIIGIIGNMITGSTTVGVITAASLVAPMLGNLNLSPEAAMLSGASGSVIIKYVNSSYFWICTSLSKMKVKDAILGYGGTTLIGGLFTFLAVYVMWAAGLI